MQTIDERRLEADTAYRYQYVTEFIGFDESDAARIHASAGIVGPLIPQLVEQTYEKLLSYDATARHFIPRQHGYDGPTPDSVSDLTANHEQIQFRKDHLMRYFMHLLGHAYNDKMGAYLDMVGKMHTPLAGNKAIDVPLVQMNALMGVISDVLTEAILNSQMGDEAKYATLRSFNKLMWVQNDFINRHYASTNESS